MMTHGVNLVQGIREINTIICCGVNLMLGKIQNINAIITIFVNLVVLKIDYV